MLAVDISVNHNEKHQMPIVLIIAMFIHMTSLTSPSGEEADAKSSLIE